MKTLVCFVLAASMLNSVAHAEIIYDNFGPGDSFNLNSGELFGLNNGTFRERGPSISFGSNYVLDSVDTAIRRDAGSNFVNLSLFDATANGRPNTALETVTALASTSTAQLTTFSFSGTTQMDAGETYFLIATPGNSTSAGVWNYNVDSMTRGIGALRTNGGNWTLVDSIEVAFRVQGTIVIPEPGCVSLVGVLAGIMLTRRRTRA